MGTRHPPQKLAKYLSYLLGRRPDEFGLIPDAEGFVKIKDLLKALWEEGETYVRRANLNEILLVIPNPLFEIAEQRIRAVDRSLLPAIKVADAPPKLLFTCVRRRAYPRVFERGLFPNPDTRIVLSADKPFAERLGRRIDQEPVTLTVNTQTSQAEGVVFDQFGQTLFIADWLNINCFTGPPLPKEKPVEPRSTAIPAKPYNPIRGTYVPDTQKISNPAASKRDSPTGSKDGERRTKRKRTRERPPWRR